MAVRQSAEPAQEPDAGRLHRARRVLGEARERLGRRALHLIGFLVFAYLFLKLVPGFKDALESLRDVSVAWIVGALFVETLSQCGYVVSWSGILDPDGL